MTTDDDGNGWRHGRDPVLRWLRILTVLVILGMFVYLVTDRHGIDDTPTVALALGAILVLLGYEGLIRLPYIGRDKDDD